MPFLKDLYCLCRNGEKAKQRKKKAGKTRNRKKKVEKTRKKKKDKKRENRKERDDPTYYSTCFDASKMFVSKMKKASNLIRQAKRIGSFRNITKNKLAKV